MQYKRVLYYNTNQSFEALPGTWYVTKSDTLPAFTEKVNKATTNSFADSISLTEVVTRSKVQVRVLHDSITLVEKLVKKTTKVIAHSLSLVENLIPNKIQFRSFNDHLTLTEVFTKQKVRIQTFVEKLTLIEFVREFKNGVVVGKWTKISKPFITWTKILKIDP